MRHEAALMFALRPPFSFVYSLGVSIDRRGLRLTFRDAQDPAGKEATVNLNLQIDGGEDSLVAIYDCPCGCKPRVGYDRGGDVATDGCCCGNQFAVGPGASRHLHVHDGFRTEVQAVNAPWGEPIEVAWSIGASTHSDAAHSH